MAAPLQSFLFQYGSEMAGKNIGLIVSSASSGISGVESDAKRLIPDGKFLSPSLWIRSSQTSNAKSLLRNWLETIDYNNLTSGIYLIDPDRTDAFTVYSLSLPCICLTRMLRLETHHGFILWKKVLP